MSPTLQYPAFVLSDLRILVLDDIAQKRNKLVDALKNMGATLVTQAVDWATGLKLLKNTKHKFDIVLCDMELDCTDGIEFMHHAAAGKVGGCILTDSKKADANFCAKAITSECGLPLLGVLPEPIELDSLKKLLRDYCEIRIGTAVRTEEPAQQQWTRNELYGALCLNQFLPVFQPKVDLATGRTTSVEMLARWNHPDLGILPPSQFIELMEQDALIDHLTDILLQQSLIRIRQWNTKGLNVGLAINFSPLTLQDPRISSRVSSLLAHYGIHPSQITIEVTETAAAKDFDAVLASLTQLKRLGCKISIDDFGMGYSSLQLLSQMPFTELKIDRMFVAGIRDGSKSTIILESIMELANRLGMRTVAEGIETKQEADFIKSLGCTAGQGFYFSKPLTFPNFVKYVEADCLREARHGEAVMCLL